jgi:hypothetical protein
MRVNIHVDIYMRLTFIPSIAVPHTKLVRDSTPDLLAMHFTGGSDFFDTGAFSSAFREACVAMASDSLAASRSCSRSARTDLQGGIHGNQVSVGNPEKVNHMLSQGCLTDMMTFKQCTYICALQPTHVRPYLHLRKKRASQTSPGR